MLVCELCYVIIEDIDFVYVFICELFKNEFDYQVFRDGFVVNLLDFNVYYCLVLCNGEVVGMISLYMQFYFYYVNWIGEIQELVVLLLMWG